MIEIEVCINCDSKQSINDSVSAAYLGGAARVELCSAMHLDGLTPTVDHMIEARKAFKDRPGLIIMIRPRPGDFYYSRKEVDDMIKQIHHAAEAGADGIVLGILKSVKNSPDIDILEKLIGISSQYDLAVTFHRAFDASPNPLKTIELLIQLGIDRVLTSGTKWGEKGNAIDGISRLEQIVEMADGRIEIVIGGGININNIGYILSRIPLSGNKISVHSFSGVQKNGVTDLDSVKSLINEIHRISNL